MSIRSKRKSRVRAGPLAPDEFDSKNVKVRITTFLDGDLVLALKRMAASMGLKYQTLLNQIVRDYVGSEKGEFSLLTESRLRRIVQEELRKSA